MEVVGEVCERRAALEADGPLALPLILLSATALSCQRDVRYFSDGCLKCPRARPPSPAAFHLFSVCHSPFKPNLSSLHCCVKAGWRRGDIPVASFIFRQCRCSRVPGKKGPFFAAYVIGQSVQGCVVALVVSLSCAQWEREEAFFFFFGDLHDH